MVPIKLKLRNFMAYREATLDFQGIHLAALTGENGAGKSTLLDAITWAIWGRGRAKRDDELVRLGQIEMEVEYTFALNDNVYRIIRKRDSSKRGRTDLSFQVEDAGGWRTLTETNLRATERRINQIMRLDYDTFINSAFLLQGRADEFTTKAPAQRKKILSDILGLELYDTYAERAKEHANQKEAEANGVEAYIKQLQAELAKEPEYRLRLAEAEKRAAESNAALQEAEKEMQALRDQHRVINHKQSQLNDLQDRLFRAKGDIEESGRLMEDASSRMLEYQAILAQRTEIEVGQEQLQQARQRVKDWEQRLQESYKLTHRRQELDQALNAAKAEIEADLRGVSATINLLAPKVAALEAYCQQLTEAQVEQDRLQRLELEQEKRREHLATLGPEAARLEEQNRQLKTEMDDIKTKLTQLEGAGSSCPVCKRPLDEQHRLEVAGQFQLEGRTKGDLFRTNRGRLSEISEQQRVQQQALAETDKMLRSLSRVQARVGQLEQSVQEARAATVDLEKAQQHQAFLRQRLETNDFATEVLAGLAEVNAELEALGYNKNAHDQARLEADRLLHFEEKGRILADAEKRLKDEEKRMEREKARYERLMEQTAKDRERVAELEQETAGLAELSIRLNEASARVGQLDRSYREARDEVARARQLLDNVAYNARKLGEQEEKLQQIREILGIYRELQVAFGKKGVQALLIESAIPEIEDEANRLLNRMTDGRMSLHFETQREARSGDSTIETLDIRIADEMGTRDYELYSGGEAFRINFAIRIAISKVLARRAGASLQTLVMDEGFGTQDAQGRERLVEAINAIQDDFEKIFVITHIDELKDAFPVQIHVWKTAEGSQVAIR